MSKPKIKIRTKPETIIYRHGIKVNGHIVDGVTVEKEIQMYRVGWGDLYNLTVDMTIHKVDKDGFYVWALDSGYRYGIRPCTEEQLKKFLKNEIKWGWVKYKNDNKEPNTLQEEYDMHYCAIGFTDPKSHQEFLDRCSKYKR